MLQGDMDTGADGDCRKVLNGASGDVDESDGSQSPVFGFPASAVGHRDSSPAASEGRGLESQASPEFGGWGNGNKNTRFGGQGAQSGTQDGPSRSGARRCLKASASAASVTGPRNVGEKSALVEEAAEVARRSTMCDSDASGVVSEGAGGNEKGDKCESNLGSGTAVRRYGQGRSVARTSREKGGLQIGAERRGWANEEIACEDEEDGRLGSGEREQVGKVQMAKGRVGTRDVMHSAPETRRTRAGHVLDAAAEVHGDTSLSEHRQEQRRGRKRAPTTMSSTAEASGVELGCKRPRSAKTSAAPEERSPVSSRSRGRSAVVTATVGVSDRLSNASASAVAAPAKPVVGTRKPPSSARASSACGKGGRAQQAEDSASGNGTGGCGGLGESAPGGCQAEPQLTNRAASRRERQGAAVGATGTPRGLRSVATTPAHSPALGRDLAVAASRELSPIRERPSGEGASTRPTGGWSQGLCATGTGSGVGIGSAEDMGRDGTCWEGTGSLTPRRGRGAEEKAVALIGFGSKDRARLGRIVEGLHGRIVEDPAAATHVVADAASSSARFLAAVALAARDPGRRPVVMSRWLEHCRDAKTWLSPAAHTLRDPDTEQRLNFSLATALSTSPPAGCAHGGVFAGLSFAVDAGVSRLDAERMVCAAGGRLISERRERADYLVVAGSGGNARKGGARGVPVTVEWIRDCILRRALQPLGA